MKSFSHHTDLLTRKQYTSPALILSLLLATSGLASSQPVQEDPYNPYDYGGRLTPTMAVVVVAVVVLLFFIGFFTIYIRHCTGATDGITVNPWVGARRVVANAATEARGIHESTVETFPTFVYSEVKTKMIGKGVLECAICLNEFEDDETLRLLPKCDHVFHPHCIGAWLQGHVTCPVCRTNLADQNPFTEPIEPVVITETDLESQQQTVVPEPGVESIAARVKFSRSHTTGHSVELPGECTERFTLRLPDDLRKKMMANWKMNRSNSLLVLPRGGSSRSGKPVDRSMRLFIKTPSFKWRNRDDGSVRLGGTGSIRGNAVTSSPTSDSVRADRWSFLRNTSVLWRSTPVPSPRVEVNKDGEGTSQVQAQLTSGSFRLPV